jgi:uncharacterized protein YkwD
MPLAESKVLVPADSRVSLPSIESSSMPRNRLTWTIALYCFVLCIASALHAQKAAPASAFDAAAEAQTVDLINQARAQHSLPPLAVDDRLTQAARKHTELMVQNRTLSHQFPGEPGPQTRMSNEGLPSDADAENVVMNQTVAGAHDALMHSPPHRANILGADYNVIGVGVLRSGDNIWITEDFARRLPQMSEPQAEAAVQTAIEHYERAHGFSAPSRKEQIQLRRLACDMALNDKLDLTPASHLAGVHEVFAWTSGDPSKLPKGIDRVLSGGLRGGYSLGACFAPSVSHSGGIYWLVMVGY